MTQDCAPSASLGGRVAAPGTARTIATLDDVRRIEATPLEAQPDFLPSPYAILQTAAERHGARTALTLLDWTATAPIDRSWTYAALFETVNRAARALGRLGVGASDAVGLLLPSLPETHAALWAASSVAVAMPLNPVLEPQAIAGLLATGGAKVLITLGEALSPELWRKALDVAARVEGLQTILALGAEPGRVMAGGRELRLISWREALGAESGDPLEVGDAPDKVIAYFHTGGTTGAPKLARHTQRQQAFVAWTVQRLNALTTESVVLCGLPLFHVNGVFVTGLGPFAAGARVVLLGPHGYRTPGALDQVWPVVQAQKVTHFSGVPTIFSALLAAPPSPGQARSLRLANCGAAPMPRQLIHDFEALAMVKIIEGYGLTEGGCVSAVNPLAGEQRPGSVGLRIPYQAMRAARRSPDGEWRSCAADEIGSIQIRGPNLFAGYVGRPAAADADGWFDTGDLGRQDADGYFWLTGRAKDVIIRGGHNIDPAVVEDALAAHPAVALAAAVGQPDPHAGELPCAFVQLRPGAEATAEDLLAFARANVSERAAGPVHVEIVAAMPLTAVGKIFKPPLRCAAIARVVRRLLAEVGASARVAVDASPAGELLARVELTGGSMDAARAQLARLALKTELVRGRPAADASPAAPGS